MKVGDIEVLPVVDGLGREVAREVLHREGAGGDPWACHGEYLDGQGRLGLTLGGFLVRSADRTIIVDAGAGPINNGKYAGGGFLDSLRAYGVAPADVTDVLFTHLHFDHVGWATRKGEIVFPAATYRVHAADWAHFVDSPDADPGAVRKLSPLTARLETFATDCTLAPGVDARPVPGHTPGSTIYVLSSGGQRALLLGDVVHSVVELLEPDWQAVFDVDPRAAAAVRSQLVRELESSPAPVAAAHFPGLRFGRIVTAGQERRWTFLGED